MLVADLYALFRLNRAGDNLYKALAAGAVAGAGGVNGHPRLHGKLKDVIARRSSDFYVTASLALKGDRKHRSPNYISR
jgi:hypothetical protein